MVDYVVSNANPEVVELPKAFNGAPEQLHGGQIDYASFGDNPTLKRASDALQLGWDRGNAINELRANPHDEDRAATHDRKVRERADSDERFVNEAIGGAEVELKTELRRAELALDEKAGLKANPAHFDAITSAFHSMKPSARITLINELIDQGDHASLATLIEAPLFLTGLSADVRDGIKGRVLKRVDPQGLALRDQLAKALEKVVNGHIASLGMFNKLRAGTSPGAWKDRARMTAAHNMAANFGR